MLRPEEIAHFIDQGYVCVRQAFPHALADECRLLAAEQLHTDLTHPASWTRPVVRGLAEGEPIHQAANTPKLLEAVAQLVDPEMWQRRPNLGAFAVRFPSVEDPGDAGWHIDCSYQPEGDDRWFVNVRSKHRALLLLCLLSDVGVVDAPTRLLPGSHLPMARLLAPAGEAGLAGAYAGQRSEVPLPDTSGPVKLATGEAGDVFLCHPFLVHAASWPHRGTSPRFITQPPIGLTGSLSVHARRDRLSPVARAIRQGLDDSTFNWSHSPTL